MKTFSQFNENKNLAAMADDVLKDVRGDKPSGRKSLDLNKSKSKPTTPESRTSDWAGKQQSMDLKSAGYREKGDYSSRGGVNNPTPSGSRVTRRNDAASDAARKDRTPAQQASREAKAERKAAQNISKRKQGVGAGVKSALGGDVVGMRGRKGESKAETRQRTDMNRKNRGDFAKKKTQQAGNLAKSGLSAAGSAVKRGFENDQSTNMGPQGSSNLEGSRLISRGKR